MRTSASYTIIEVYDGDQTFVKWGTSSSNTSVHASLAFGDTEPTPQANVFIWRKEGHGLSIASATWGNPICMTGATGDKGDAAWTYVTLTSGYDLNNAKAKDTAYISSSTAICNSLLNKPTGFIAGEVRVEVEWLGSNSYIIQRLYCKAGSSSKNFTRTYSSGTWGSWVENKGDKGDKGDKGSQGPQGIQGPAGADGSSLYTWVAYADDSSGSGISASSSGKAYVGFAYNKTEQSITLTPALFSWARIEGPQGTSGPSGATLYTWLKYADTPTSGMSNLPDGKKYIGLAYNKPTSVESETYSVISGHWLKAIKVTLETREIRATRVIPVQAVRLEKQVSTQHSNTMHRPPARHRQAVLGLKPCQA